MSIPVEAPMIGPYCKRALRNATRIRIQVSLTGMLLCAMSSAVGATTWRVPQDTPTIGAGLAMSTEGDTVLVDCGLYFESDLHVPQGVVLRSAEGDPECVTIDARSANRVLYLVAVDSATRIEGLTLSGGQPLSTPAMGGAAYLLYTTARFSDCRFTGNFAETGGALHLNQSSPRIERCVFDANVATDAGGAIYVEDSTPEVVDCSFSANRSSARGGAIGSSGASKSIVRDCVFVDNVSPHWAGGAVACFAGAGASIEGCSFERNTSVYGAAIYLHDAEDVSISRSVFIANQAESSGAGIYCFDSVSTHVESSTFHQNTASYGSFLWVIGSTVTAHGVLCTSGSSSPVSCRDATGIVSFECSNLWMNAGGDWIDCVADQHGVNGNFSWDPAHCDASSGDLRLAEDSQCLPSGNPCRAQIGALGVGCPAQVTAAGSSPTVQLGPVYPNPFRGSTNIRFANPLNAHVNVEVFDLAGRRIRTLEDGRLGSGEHSVRWDGRDANRRPVASGVYMLRVRVGTWSGSQRVVLLR
jgi:predicted outer membrane repeat protein